VKKTLSILYDFIVLDVEGEARKALPFMIVKIYIGFANIRNLLKNKYNYLYNDV